MKKQLPAKRALHAAVACLAACAVGQAAADPLTLAPALPGMYAPGSGVDGKFLKISDDWRGSSVHYDADSDTLHNGPGVGDPVGSFRNGSGLWGLADWRTVNALPSDDPLILAQWNGRVASIGYGDAQYADETAYVSEFGVMPLAPLFEPGITEPTQENWTSYFSGYLRITQPGIYNFGVLHDDGFFFSLTGALGKTLDISNDFLNPPTLTSFGSGLRLDTGLYAFELGAYERLEVGVVELSWSFDGSEFSRVPGAHLVAAGDIAAVPEPATASLLIAGLGGLLAGTRRRRTAR